MRSMPHLTSAMTSRTPRAGSGHICSSRTLRAQLALQQSCLSSTHLRTVVVKSVCRMCSSVRSTPGVITLLRGLDSGGTGRPTRETSPRCGLNLQPDRRSLERSESEAEP